MLQVHTLNRPYYDAGKKYGWSGAGLGISTDKLEGKGTLFCKVKNKDEMYTIDKREARELAEQHNSYISFKAKSKIVKLAILPWKHFKKV